MFNKRKHAGDRTSELHFARANVQRKRASYCIASGIGAHALCIISACFLARFLVLAGVLQHDRFIFTAYCCAASVLYEDLSQIPWSVSLQVMFPRATDTCLTAWADPRAEYRRVFVPSLVLLDLIATSNKSQ